jgi:hypothetical protein
MQKHFSRAGPSSPPHPPYLGLGPRPSWAARSVSRPCPSPLCTGIRGSLTSAARVLRPSHEFRGVCSPSPAPHSSESVCSSTEDPNLSPEAVMRGRAGPRPGRRQRGHPGVQGWELARRPASAGYPSGGGRGEERITSAQPAAQRRREAARSCRSQSDTKAPPASNSGKPTPGRNPAFYTAAT